ncbi:L,D-transpeptidase, partial [Mesorhizobium sp. M1C.F.Ca.ET.144.01.1.1]
MRELPQGLTPPRNGDAIETDLLLSRRAVLSGAGALALLGVAGCSTVGGGMPALELDDTVTGSVPHIR